jgi:hypothetical protein
LCEANERHALIIVYSLGNPKLPTDFIERADVVEGFAKRYNFTSVTVLKDEQATLNAVESFFAEQAQNCLSHGDKNSTKKYLLMVYYSGHGKLTHGT